MLVQFLSLRRIQEIEYIPMVRSIVIAMALIFSLSHCGDDPSNKKPKNKKPAANQTQAKKTKAADTKAKVEIGSNMDDEQIAKAQEIISGISKEDIAAINAKKVFKANCASCHGFTGDLGINGSKDLTKSTISLTEAVAQVYHGKGLMLPYKDVLTEAELVAVAKYTEGLRK